MNTKIFIFLCLSLVLIGQINVMPVDADRIETLKVRHSEAPDVCIFNPDPEMDGDRAYNFEVLTKISVNKWVEALQEHYPKGDWELKVHDPISFVEHDKAPASDYKHCNILLTFEIIDSDMNSERLGMTQINFSNSNHKYMIITVFTYQFDNSEIMLSDDGKTITRQIIPHSLDTIQSVITHELGHAFGLFHYNISTPLRVDEIGSDRSVMYPSLNPEKLGTVDIKPPEIYMIGQIYGEDGWGGYEYPVMIKQCDFISNWYDSPDIVKAMKIGWSCKW